MLIRRSKYSAI